MAKTKVSRVAWVLAAILAAALLGGIVPLSLWLRSYWTAKYRGNEADLHGVVLILAPLADADLTNADLHGADLRGADLRRCPLMGDLHGADLSGANLAGAQLGGAKLLDARLVGATLAEAELGKADLRGADLRRANLKGADLERILYDRRTRWPAGFAVPADENFLIVPGSELP